MLKFPDYVFALMSVIAAALIFKDSWPLACAFASSSVIVIATIYTGRRDETEISEMKLRIDHLEERIKTIAVGRSMGAR